MKRKTFIIYDGYIALIIVIIALIVVLYMLTTNRAELYSPPTPTKVYTEHKPTTCFPLYGLEDDNEWFICMGVPIK